MTNHADRPLVSPFHAQAELELLHSILDESATYPLNPFEPQAEAYFAALEQEVLASGWSEADFVEHGQRLANHIEQLWQQVEPVTLSIQAALRQRFGVCAPQALLDGILQRAQQVVSQKLAMADQLVQCVQECLPTWSNDDLQVFARPLAYAMRGPEAEKLDSMLQSVRSVEWTELSDVEQARLSLVIARYTLAQLAETTRDA